MRMTEQPAKTTNMERRLQFCNLLKSIVQRKIGEHDQCLMTATECINKYPEFKDAYLVRGQINLLQKRSQKAVQDFMEFNSLASQELAQATQSLQMAPKAQVQGGKQQKGVNSQSMDHSQILFQVAIGQELLGDAYKKMKKHKLAN